MKDIPGYENRYQVTSTGEVWSLIGAKKRLKPSTKKCGHQQVILSKNRKTKKMHVHKAVLLAYVGPPEAGQVCRHLNGDPADNRLENLCWGTVQENSDDKKRHGTMAYGEKSGQAKLTWAKAEEIRTLAAQGWSGRKLGRHFNVAYSTVFAVIWERTWRLENRPPL